MTPLAYWSIAWTLGIWLSRWMAVPVYVWGGVATLSLMAAIPLHSQTARRALVCIAALALAGVRLTLAQPGFDERSLVQYNDRGERILTGVVAGEPDVRGDHVTYDLNVERVGAQAGPFSLAQGAARVRGPRYPVYAYGDRLQVRGEPETPPVLQDMDYREYLAGKGIYTYVYAEQVERLGEDRGSVWQQALLHIKGRARETIGRILPEPEASLLAGILLGIEGEIPSETMAAFSTTGTTHVIAISGFNIAIIVGLLMATVGRLVRDRRLAGGIAVAGVLLYTILVGGDAAVVRAAVMGTLAVVGMSIGRQGLAYNSLAAGVIFLTAWNPFTLWNIGFQLSVAATLGLILYGDLFKNHLQRLIAQKIASQRAEQLAEWANEALLLTLAAQITTLPLIVRQFGQLSLVTLFTNLLVLPVQPLLMVCGGAATLVGLLFEPLGRVLGWAAYLWLTWTIRVVEWTAEFPHAAVSLRLSDAGLVAIYGGMAVMTGVVRMPAQQRQDLFARLRSRLALKLALGGLAVATVVAWFAVLQFPDQRLKVVFLDVGQGDAIFVQTPQGVQMLIDGGPAGGNLLSRLGQQMPFWDRSLDLVFLTHPDSDHLSGLVPVLERYGVRAVIASAEIPESELARAWEQALTMAGVQRIQPGAGTRIESGDGVAVEVLYPDPGASLLGVESNDRSLVMRLKYRDVSFLLTGDIGAAVEGRLVRSGAYLPSTVLKVAHHGGDSSSSTAFLKAVQPQVAVISVGENNTFGHPSYEVLDRLEEALLYRTDRDGTVAVSTDGHTLWIETDR
jgi:competence protein ComEC